MKITKITTRKYPDQIIVRVILDTSRFKERAKELFERMADINDQVDNKIDKITGRIVDLFG